MFNRRKIKQRFLRNWRSKFNEIIIILSNEAIKCHVKANFIGYKLVWEVFPNVRSYGSQCGSWQSIRYLMKHILEPWTLLFCVGWPLIMYTKFRGILKRSLSKCGWLHMEMTPIPQSVLVFSSVCSGQCGVHTSATKLKKKKMANRHCPWISNPWYVVYNMWSNMIGCHPFQL